MSAAPEYLAGASGAVAAIYAGVSGIPGAGRYIELSLAVRDHHVVDAEFNTNGCPAAQAAVCTLATFLKGRTLEQASRLDANDLLVLIGGLPEGKGYYAGMAIEALRDALKKVSQRIPK